MRPFDLDLDGDLAMTEPQVKWTARVEETFYKLRYADRDAQELACRSIQEEFGSEEAGARLRELFKTDRAKLLERAAEITAKIENGKTEAEASNPKVQPIRVEPKVGAGGGWRFVQKADGSKWWVKGNDWRRHFGPTGKPEEKKAAVALKVVEQRKPEPEPEPEPAPELEKEKEWSGVLDRAAPLDNARKLIGFRYWHKPAMMVRLKFWQGEFWEWQGKHWKVVDNNTMRSGVTGF